MNTSNLEPLKAISNVPWPRQVTRVVARAIADFGIENFVLAPTIDEDGGDYGTGCFVSSTRSGAIRDRISDGRRGTRWCVGVNIPDALYLGDPKRIDEVRAKLRETMDIFVEHVLGVAGWRPYPLFTTCAKCTSPTRWLPVYSPTGGYGHSWQCYLIWDEDIERADLARAEEKP